MITYSRWLDCLDMQTEEEVDHSFSLEEESRTLSSQRVYSPHSSLETKQEVGEEEE